VEATQFKDIRKQFERQYNSYLSSTPKDKQKFTSRWSDEKRQRSTPLPTTEQAEEKVSDTGEERDVVEEEKT
jgi:hypothetical protein